MASSPSEKKPINLLRGWPAPDLLPAEALGRAASKVLADPTVYVPSLQYGPDGGYLPLRQEIAKWLGRFYGTDPDPERICITGGASQNLARILQSFTDPVYTRGVWMVAPCYFLACPIFADAGFAGRLRAFPEDDEGVDLEYLERGLEGMEHEKRGEGGPFKHPGNRKLYRYIIYVVPTCANPSGKSMSLRRREGLVRLARKYDALIICDDVYDLLQWPAPASGDWPSPSPERPPEMKLPRLSDVDRSMGPAEQDPLHFGNAVSNGSFSKIVGPGVRTGWVDATPAFAFGLSQTGSTKSGGAPSQLTASIVCAMLKSGDIDSHIENAARPALQRRHKLISDAVHRHIAPLGIDIKKTSLPGSDIYGGYFIWFSLPDSLSAKRAAEMARESENLIVGHGDLFEVHGDEDSVQFKNDIRLCFSWEPEDSIVEGVERLGSVLRRMIRGVDRAARDRSEDGDGDRRPLGGY